jgi:hypothetical protein
MVLLLLLAGTLAVVGCEQSSPGTPTPEVVVCPTPTLTPSNTPMPGLPTNAPTPVPPTNTPTPMPPTNTPWPPTPTPTPGPMLTPTPHADLFRITSQKISIAGGMANHLRTEPEALVLARIAIGEGQEENLLEQEYIMWTVRARAAIGFANGGGHRGVIVTPTTINDEALNGNAYHAIQGILSYTAPEHTACHNNLTRMTYPCNGKFLDDFNEAYQKAIQVMSKAITEMPEPVRGFESFASTSTTQPGLYCTEGEFDSTITRRHAQLAPSVNPDSHSTIFRDCYLNDNDLLVEHGLSIPRP